MSALALLWALACGPALAAPTVGDPALLFALPAIDGAGPPSSVGGDRVALADFVGLDPVHPTKVLVLFFFDRSNGAERLAGLSRLQRSHGAQDLQAVGVFSGTDDLGDLSAWLKGEKLAFPVLRDHHGIVMGRYELPSLPMVAVIDGEGTLQAIGRPGTDVFEVELGALVAGLLD